MNAKSDDLFNEFEREINKLATRHAPHFCVALSGGLDSIVLLHLFSRLKASRDEITVTAHHVHHGLSENADHWLNVCQTQCKNLDLPFRYSNVNLQKTSRTSLEALARDKRYESLKKGLTEQSFLATAHHQDDQLETVLLALKRGSGIAGLQGIRSIQTMNVGFLIRPLLIFSRNQLEEYAQLYKLDWIEDESNQDEQFDRNFIRQSVSPLLKARWPAITKTFSRSASILQEQNALLEELAIDDLSGSLNNDDKSIVNLEKLSELSISRQKNTLRYWFKSHNLQYPSSKQLTAIFNELIKADQQATPQITFEHLILRRYRSCLYLTAKATKEIPDKPIAWHKETTLFIDGMQGALSFNISQEKGLIVNENDCVEIYFRKHLSNKLTCTPKDRHRSRSIKKLLHEYHVPPWQRDQIPFIFIDGELKQAVGLWVCDDKNKMKEDSDNTLLNIHFL